MAWPMIAMAAISVAGSMMKAKGQAQQFAATEKAAEMKMELALENAEFSEENAEIVRSKARAQAKQLDRIKRLRIGAIQAAAGASGGRLNRGSVQDILMDVTAQSQLEIQNALFEGELSARGELHTAKGFRVQAQLAKEEAKSAGKAGGGAMTSGMLGAATGMIGMGKAGGLF